MPNNLTDLVRAQGAWDSPAQTAQVMQGVQFELSGAGPALRTFYKSCAVSQIPLCQDFLISLLKISPQMLWFLQDIQPFLGSIFAFLLEQ